MSSDRRSPNGRRLSVPDADTLIRLAEILEVSVSELLGTNIAKENTAGNVAEQLSRINEQLANQKPPFAPNLESDRHPACIDHPDQSFDHDLVQRSRS